VAVTWGSHVVDQGVAPGVAWSVGWRFLELISLEFRSVTMFGAPSGEHLTRSLSLVIGP